MSCIFFQRAMTTDLCILDAVVSHLIILDQSRFIEGFLLKLYILVCRIYGDFAVPAPVSKHDRDRSDRDKPRDRERVVQDNSRDNLDRGRDRAGIDTIAMPITNGEKTKSRTSRSQ